MTGVCGADTTKCSLPPARDGPYIMPAVVGAKPEPERRLPETECTKGLPETA